MIAKITRGGSFRGAARYVLDERRGLDRDHQPEMIGGDMAGRTKEWPSNPDWRARPEDLEYFR